METQNETQELSYREMMNEAFRYWEEIPELAPQLSLAELIRTYERQADSFYFHPDNLKYFGSRGGTLVARGLYLECQTKSPAGMDRYRVTAFVIDKHGEISPVGIGRFSTRGKAVRRAAELSRGWETRRRAEHSYRAAKARNEAKQAN